MPPQFPSDQGFSPLLSGTNPEDNLGRANQIGISIRSGGLTDCGRSSASGKRRHPVLQTRRHVPYGADRWRKFRLSPFEVTLWLLDLVATRSCGLSHASAAALRELREAFPQIHLSAWNRPSNHPLSNPYRTGRVIATPGHLSGRVIARDRTIRKPCHRTEDTAPGCWKRLRRTS
jgi:hypothetical protein